MIPIPDGIVKQLIKFSRKAVPQKITVSVVEVVQEALGFLRSTLPANIQFRLDLAGEDLMILADPIQINQLMMNICINAAQAMEASGGTIDIQLGPANLTGNPPELYKALPPGDYIRITI